MADLCRLSATDLRRLIGRREVSPVELVEASIERIEAVDHAVNAMVTRAFDEARAAARRAEAGIGADNGPLHGLPVAIKDLNATKGIRTTWGSVLYAHHVPAEDEGVVAAVKAAGGIVIGKTNTPEYGAGGNTRNDVFGPTGNPYDPQLTCGGSSGGAAVSLATGMVPLATGSDFGGSLRTPAAFCGVVGFRPSAGLIPEESRVVGLSPFPVEGPMARNVADAHLLLTGMMFHDPADPFSRPVEPALVAPLRPADLSRLRLAFSGDLGFAAVDPGIRGMFRQRIARLAPRFAESSEAAPPMQDAEEVFETLRGLFMVSSYGQILKATPDRLGPNTRDNTERGLSLHVERIARAFAKQTRHYRAFNRFFRDFDVLICPATSVPAFPHRIWYPAAVEGRSMTTYMTWLALTWGITMAQGVVCAIPCGQDAQGLPFGLQVVGPSGSDREVLEIALALEAAIAGEADLALPPPDIDALRLAPALV